MPTLFDGLELFDFLRGWPVAYLLAITAAALFVIRDWRGAILILNLQYLLAGLAFVDVLAPRLSFVKVVVGLFVCLIFYFTGRQVNWGMLPTDLTETEAESLQQDRRVRLGSVPLSLGTPLRLAIAAAVLLVAWALTRQSQFQLPVVPEHFSLAVYALVALGLLNTSLTAEPLTAGIGLATFLIGFELFYGSLEQAAALLGALAMVNLIVAVVVAYLTQARFALPAWLDGDSSRK